jgi:hypothetical protein
VSANERIEVPASRVREWARRNGIEVGSRGLLPAPVIKRFNQVHRYYVHPKLPNEGRNVKGAGDGQVQQG